MQVWLAVLFSLFITMALVPAFRSCAIRFHAVDMPNERKVHSRPMAKTGGLAMAVGALVPVLLWTPGGTPGPALLISSMTIVLFGFLDDLKDLNSKTKFAVQIGAALVVVLWGGLRIVDLGMLLPDDMQLPGFIAIPLTVLVIVGVTNAINLSDGLDGLAGGISLLIYISIVYLAYVAGNIQVTLIAAAMCGAIFGFLRFNTHPASVFMGDAGSQLLGFVAICLLLSLTQCNGPYSPLLPLLLLGFPILDTLTVMTERIATGRSPFIADKNHFHHKLMHRGLSHAEAVLLIYMLQTALIGSGYFLRYYSDWMLLGGYLAFSGFILAMFYLAHKFDWRFNDLPASGFRLRGRLQRWLNREAAIKFSFRAVQAVLPLVLLLISLLSESPPAWLAILAACLMTGILVCGRISPSSQALLLRLGIYLVPPFLIYQVELNTAQHWLTLVGNLLFCLLVVLIVMVIKFSRRAGYRSTPLDYLVLFLALLIPNLNLFSNIPDYRLSMITVKLLILFFTLEVLLEEMRARFKPAVIAECLMLSVVMLRAIF